MKQSTGRRILVVSVISLILGLPVLFGILLKNSKFGYHELPVYSSDELGIQVPYTIVSLPLID